ncbi:MAG: serine hydrolase, partial [Gemmatimonadota bacterium]|nr:serine hydrolase [Gemmatimonadota bacterium]
MLAIALVAAGSRVDALVAQAPPENGFDPEAFDAYVSEAVEAWGAPGLAIAVVHGGRVVFERGYGVLELGRPARVDEHTRFAIGSTTKAMTAAAIGLLVDEGALDWDDRVIDHLPGFRLHDPYATREVTIRDLLTHRAGLGNADFLWYEQETDADEILRKVRLLEPAYSLRSGFIYQNIMYLVAGEVVEAVSGMPWDVFVTERLFEPLDMDETVALASRIRGRPNVATPHDTVDGELRPIENASVDPVAPAGSVWSSVSDMAKWLLMLLAEGELPSGERLLEPGTVREMFTPQVVLRSQYPTTRLTRPDWMTYGLGWFQQDYRGRKVDFHTGSIDGMVAIAGLIREQDLGVYVLANRDHVEVRHALMYRVFDVFDPHGGDPRDWSTDLRELYDELAASAAEARARRLEGRVQDTEPSHPPAAYAGRYEDPLFGSVEVEREGDGLRLVYGPGLRGPLEHWHHDTFLVRFDAAWR